MGKGGRRVIGVPDFWSGQKPWWEWYLTPVVNFGEVRRAQLAKSTLLTSRLMPLDLLRSFKVCSVLRREWGAEINEKLPHLYIPSKTATWFLSLLRKTCLWIELQPRSLSLQWKIYPWVEHSDDDDVHSWWCGRNQSYSRVPAIKSQPISASRYQLLHAWYSLSLSLSQLC